MSLTFPQPPVQQPAPSDYLGIKSSTAYSVGNLSSGQITIPVGDTSNIIGLHFYSSGASLSATTGKMSCTEIFGTKREKLRLFMMTIELPYMKFISFTMEILATSVHITSITSRYSNDFGSSVVGAYEIAGMVVIRAGQ